MPVKIKQRRDSIEIIFPKIEERMIPGCRMTFAMRGLRLELVNWETFGKVPDVQYMFLGGLDLASDLCTLKGYIGRLGFVAEDGVWYIGAYIGGKYEIVRQQDSSPVVPGSKPGRKVGYSPPDDGGRRVMTPQDK